jgi:hypothetical protein
VRDGGSDASLDGSAGALPCSSGLGGIFCDDFEGATLSKWSRHSQASDGRTTRITTPVHGGQGAIRSVKSAPGPSDPLYADVLGARTSGHLYLRTYLYVPSGFAISAVDSAASLLVLGESSGALGGLSLVLWQDALSLTIEGPTRGEVKGTFALPRNRWNCVQIDFGIGQSENARLRVNGQLVAEGARDTRMATSYGRLWVGVNWIHEKQIETVQALYDDLIVSTRDVPCN